MKVLKYSRVNRNGKLIEFTYSECDQELVEKYTWGINGSGYAVTHITENGKSSTKSFHRLAFNEPKGIMIDHINGIKLDNTRQNLRKATNQQNQANRKMNSNNSSGYRGVAWSKRYNKWSATIKVNGRSINLKCYVNIEDAIRARKEAEEKYFGEYARKDE